MLRLNTLMEQTKKMILRRFSKVVCVLTAFLIFAGGMVTSTGSGLSVPDWPLSYGTLFPPMVGGVFYEHSHRMIASVVGFCMMILAILLAWWEKRPWVKKLGLSAFAAVVAQGILGGLTVLFFLPTPISVTHAILAQTFFVLTVILAYSQSQERSQRELKMTTVYPATFTKWVLFAPVAIYGQLILGALMRHTKSGLAIPDFPTMGGMVWPMFDLTMLNRINYWRFDMNLPPVTMNQVLIHFAHRMGAVVVFAVIMLVTLYALRLYRHRFEVMKLVLILDSLLLIQIILGALTVISEKTPSISSLHVFIGAILLGTGVLLALRVLPLQLSDIKRNFC